MTISCTDGCGATVEDEKAAGELGWAWLSIRGGYRCGPCDHALYAANKIVSTAGVTADELPADSRGALKKETASTIAAPSVKG